jgi:hypothetical protein
MVMGCCPNSFSPVLKGFMTNLRLAPGDSKTHPTAQPAGIDDLWHRQDLEAKGVSMNHSKEFLFEQQPVSASSLFL